MGIQDTEYKNLTYKELFTMLEGLKNSVLSEYKDEFFYDKYQNYSKEFDNVKDGYRSILKEFHNRICKNIGDKLGIIIPPTNVAVRVTDMKNTIFKNNGKIDLGEFDHRDQVVYINLLVNPVEAKNYQFKKFVDNWTMEMINSLFHETFHYIQQICFSEPTSNNNELKFIKNYTKANLFCRYDSSDVYHQYMCNMLEMDARKFALESLQEFYKKGDILFNCDEYFADEYFFEIAVMGNKFEHLKTAQAKYKLANMMFMEEDFRDTIDEFYNNQTEYYTYLNDKANKLNIENLKVLDKCSFIDTLSITQINALTHDYKNYLNSADKKQFLKSIERTNEIIDSNIPASEKNNKDYKLNKFKSFLPEYLNELNKEKNNDIEK